jgi:hypothetical protein
VWARVRRKKEQRARGWLNALTGIKPRTPGREIVIKSRVHEQDVTSVARKLGYVALKLPMEYSDV